MNIEPNVLNKARLGRSSAKHLEQLVATHTLTQEDLARLLKRIRDGFDAVLGAEPTEPQQGLRVIDGGRA